MGCKQSVYVSQDVEHKKCLEFLSSVPNLKEYQKDQEALKTIGQMYKSQVYGTSVLNPVGDQETKKRTRKNPLTDEINKFNVQHLYLGGWKEIAHVKVDPEDDLESEEGAAYCHIYMLVDSVHMAEEKNLIMQSDKIPMKDRLHIGELEFDQIKASMNGFGRVIYFQAYGDHKPQNQRIESIQEGTFKNGLMHGYAREFYTDIENDSSWCECGYYKDGQPSGKFIEFNLDGSTLAEGIKEGDERKKEYKIQNFMTQYVKQGAKQGTVGVASNAKKYPDGPISRDKCTHICKWDTNATGGRWFECVILQELEAFYKVKGHDGDVGNIPKGDIIKKEKKGKVEEGDKVVAYYDDRAYAFKGECTGVTDEGIAVHFADGDQGLAWEGKVWKLNKLNQDEDNEMME